MSTETFYNSEPLPLTIGDSFCPHHCSTGRSTCNISLTGWPQADAPFKQCGMSDFYSQPPAPAANVAQEVVGLKFEGQTSHNFPPNNVSSASSYANLGFLFGVQDPAVVAPKSSRSRRKPAHGSEHVKHRRTRSGCYTCRSRRVKVC